MSNAIARRTFLTTAAAATAAGAFGAPSRAPGPPRTPITASWPDARPPCRECQTGTLLCPDMSLVTGHLVDERPLRASTTRLTPRLTRK